MNNTTNNQNVLPQIKTPKIFVPIILLILFLVISIFLIMYKVNISGSGSKEEIIKNIFIILFIGLIILSLCIGLLPNFKDIKTLFGQISSVTYIILYTIFLILFFRMVPSDIIDNYAYIILPFTIIIGAIIFYKSASYSYIDKFDVNYERLKMMIMMSRLMMMMLLIMSTFMMAIMCMPMMPLRMLLFMTIGVMSMLGTTITIMLIMVMQSMNI